MCVCVCVCVCVCGCVPAHTQGSVSPQARRQSSNGGGGLALRELGGPLARALPAASVCVCVCPAQIRPGADVRCGPLRPPAPAAAGRTGRAWPTLPSHLIRVISTREGPGGLKPLRSFSGPYIDS